MSKAKNAQMITTGWWFGTLILFFHVLGTIIPFDELIFLRGVGQPPTSIIGIITTIIIYINI